MNVVNQLIKKDSRVDINTVKHIQIVHPFDYFFGSE